ncbi:MAG TPA: SDR family NAD(P)-dependent oxidoreductase, partial [Gemmatimonadaceae bacterium]|nr:SDR family NAD(P)-dependent oxidoreductase [Gemmatimonadaceae bacterium]
MTFLNGKKILVTGADGFIGSHLCEALVRAGHDVRAFVLYNSFNSWGWLDTTPEDVASSIDVYPGDVRDPHGVREAMKGCEVVLHLAALIAIPYSYHSPDAYVETNIKGTLNILQAARELNVAKIVHTSTSEVYGTARQIPISETHPLQGQSPYSASKIGADKLAESYHLSCATPVVTVRPFNTFGPRQSARAVIPTIITQCLTGATVRLGNLTPTRDLNFVSNTVDGFVLAGTTPGIEGKTINLGSGVEISIGDLVKVITRLTGREAAVQTEE